MPLATKTMHRREIEPRSQSNAARLEYFLDDCDERVFDGAGYGIIIIKTPSGDYTVKHIDCNGIAIEFTIAPDGEIITHIAEMADRNGKAVQFPAPMSLDEVLNKVA